MFKVILNPFFNVLDTSLSDFVIIIKGNFTVKKEETYSSEENFVS